MVLLTGDGKVFSFYPPAGRSISVALLTKKMLVLN